MLRLRLVVGVVVGALVVALAGSVAADAILGAEQPAFSTADALGTGASTNYQTAIAPLVSVGSELQQGARETLFTVRAAQPAYWRLNALDQYTGQGGGGWTLNARGQGAVQQGLSGRVPAGSLRQQFQIGPLGERWMPAAFNPVRVSRSNTLVVRDSGTLVTGDASVTGISYTVESALPNGTVTLAQRAASAGPVPAALRVDTELPSGSPIRSSRQPDA